MNLHLYQNTLFMIMNIFKRSALAVMVGTLSAGLAVAMPPAALAQDYQSFRLAPGFEPDPAIGTGLSGGPRETGDCGYVDAANAPDHVITVTRPFSFLRASVEAEGDVTLLVEGPDGRYCSDDVNGLMPEISGTWPAGRYNIWIGDFVGNSSGSFRYRLYLSEY